MIGRREFLKLAAAPLARAAVGKWKAVAVDPGGAWELYDLEKDRTEMHDLARAQPQRLRAMIAQ